MGTQQVTLKSVHFLKEVLKQELKMVLGRTNRQVTGQDPADVTGAIGQLLPAIYPMVPLSCFLLK